MNPDRNDARENPARPGVPVMRDPAHDAQLLRDVATVNARTVAALGSLPPGGLPPQPRRKPSLAYRPFPGATETTSSPEDDSMKLHLLAAAALLPMAVAGCARTVDAGSAKATLNPHPVKRYEVIATSQAPGPWDSVVGTVFFDVVNKDCVPRQSFTGSQDVPSASIHFEMSRMKGDSWVGYFYRDALVDDDYFELGTCQWDATSVAPTFTIGGERFGAPTWLSDALHEGPQVTYFKKSTYRDPSLVRYGSPAYSPARPEYRRDPDAFFPIDVSVKETAP